MGREEGEARLGHRGGKGRKGGGKGFGAHLPPGSENKQRKERSTGENFSIRGRKEEKKGGDRPYPLPFYLKGRRGKKKGEKEKERAVLSKPVNDLLSREKTRKGKEKTPTLRFYTPNPPEKNKHGT